MAALGREIVNALLLGPSADGRLVHDSPIRGDVWAELAATPSGRIDVLIEGHRDTPAGLVAARLARRLYKGPSADRPKAPEHPGFGISFVEGFVTARIGLAELIEDVLPFTRWTQDFRVDRNLTDIAGQVTRQVALQLEELREPTGRREAIADVDPGIARMVATFRVLAALQWASDRAGDRFETLQDFFAAASIEDIAGRAGRLVRRIFFNRTHKDVVAGKKAEPFEVDEADIFAISRNRPVELALERSIPTVKADAVSTLFAVSCEKIGWAVLDTGIDGSHPAFKDLKRPGRNRIAATFDFTRLRRVILIDHLYNASLLEAHARELSLAIDDPNEEKIRDDLATLARDAQMERSINWGIAERYVRVKSPPVPASPHGTHVAGILGGCWDASDFGNSPPVAKRGVCPDIRLYDFRVVSNSEEDTEFALVGALQFIRHLNSRNNYPQIHGANISLSIRHDVRNYACGRTPVCDEATRAVQAGVVVVAAAGNRGYQSYHLSDGGAFETYAPSSITDPGNADAVITVGATHRSAPHTYGISFFSSRGPTGDGRAKPDLVAPGEKIWSVVPGNTEDALSGTSMAAPHVSGAAAMLMARNPEFIGETRTIKTILTNSCTDLGRERSFQGAGLLDILRAMQSV